jgi:LysM repeat protein
MNLPFRPPKKKKLQAATARRVREADYTEEPNVRLSSAFVVVLVLHVVAVGGIYAFNAIKAHQPPAFEEQETSQPQQGAQAGTTNPATDNLANLPAAAATPALPAATRTYRVKSGDTITKIATANGVTGAEIIALNNLQQQGGIHVGEELKLPAAVEDQPETPKPVTLKDSGTSYTVVHGDTPVGIAHKLHVGYDDLVRLNKIDDPKKLKIGMKLKVPAKHPAA